MRYPLGVTGRLLGLVLAMFLGGLALLPAAEIQAAAPRANEQALAKLQQHKDTRHYSFVVTGDNRDGDAVFGQLLTQAGYYKPRFMLHTGDFVRAGGQSEYQQFLGLIGRASYPVLPALGNHDAVNGGRKWYAQYFGAAVFAFAYGPDRFFFLDNANAIMPETQLKWLEAELQKPARYRFVVMHMPPRNMIWFHAFSKGSVALLDLLARYKVNYTLMGHIHIYDRMNYKGVNYLVSGGAGAPLYRMPLYFSDKGGAFYHYVLFQVSDSGIRERLVPLELKR
ncbi:MAG: metallophosphoesterase family protein [Candidatus Sericytochromatia bacterium]